MDKKELATILRRLENIAQVLTILSHFQSNIGQMYLIAAKKGHNNRLNERAKEDLMLACCTSGMVG